jgi:hypothetical protein
VAARGIYFALLNDGMEPAEARKAVQSAAHRASRRNLDFIKLLAQDDEVTSRLPAERIREIRDQVWQASRANAGRMAYRRSPHCPRHRHRPPVPPDAHHRLDQLGLRNFDI